MVIMSPDSLNGSLTSTESTPFASLWKLACNMSPSFLSFANRSSVCFSLIKSLTLFEVLLSLAFIGVSARILACFSLSSSADSLHLSSTSLFSGYSFSLIGFSPFETVFASLLRFGGFGKTYSLPGKFLVLRGRATAATALAPFRRYKFPLEPIISTTRANPPSLVAKSRRIMRSSFICSTFDTTERRTVFLSSFVNEPGSKRVTGLADSR